MDKLQHIWREWKDLKVSDSQMALNFFIMSHLEKYPHKNLEKEIESLDIICAEHDLLKRYQFKKIKEKSLICLENWVRGNWSLVLTESIPTPEEVLDFQARGLRPVTMKMRDKSRSILHRADALDFFCHDLEHGHMFFHDNNLYESQIRFFRKMQASIHAGNWSERRRCPDFEKKFVYLISDMNSHPEHYRAYLNSMLEPSEVGRFDDLFT